MHGVGNESNLFGDHFSSKTNGYTEVAKTSALVMGPLENNLLLEFQLNTYDSNRSDGHDFLPLDTHTCQMVSCCV